MSEPTVYIVDDDAALRDATKVFLELHGYRTRAFSSGEEVLASFEPAWTGCLLLDLKMPGMGGLALQQRLVPEAQALPMVMVTAHGDVATTRLALKTGAFDFLEKPVDNDVLLDVIANAFSYARERRDTAAAAQVRQERLDRLTPRERQVMRLVAAGRTHREIAQELGISPRTIEVYKTRMMEKLQARTLADVIRLESG